MKHGAGILLINDSKVLLVKAGNKSKQLNGTISFPGGFIEERENPKETALRELREETGLTTNELIDFPGNYVEASLKLKAGTKDISFKVFLALDFTGDLRSTEETEPFWADLKEARKRQLLGKNNEILENALKYLKING